MHGGGDMIKRYKLEQGHVIEAPNGDGDVLLVTEPTPEEKAYLTNELHIDEHNLASTQDPHELPRLELETDHLAVIFKQPKRYSARDKLQFRINAVGLFLFKNRLVLVTPNELPVFDGRVFSKVQNLQMLFLRILSSCITHFVQHLQVINDIGNELETKILHAMENRSLMLMFTIEKSLVYYVNAISANGRVIERLKTNAKNNLTEGLTTEMLEYVDDLAIENAQCLEQAQVYANVFTGLMDARASVVSNNLNVLMKRLTVINVVFMPLNVIAGVFGMSEYTEMTKGIPWPIAYSLFMLVLILIGFATYWLLNLLEKRSFGK
jgi:magnesium transporter